MGEVCACACILNSHTFKAACPSIRVSVCVSDGLCAPKLSILNVRVFSWLTLSLHAYVAMCESVITTTPVTNKDSHQ